MLFEGDSISEPICEFKRRCKLCRISNFSCPSNLTCLIYWMVKKLINYWKTLHLRIWIRNTSAHRVFQQKKKNAITLLTPFTYSKNLTSCLSLNLICDTRFVLALEVDRCTYQMLATHKLLKNLNLCRSFVSILRPTFVKRIVDIGAE